MPDPDTTLGTFETCVMVDWSGAGVPVTGANSIWWAQARKRFGIVALANPPTRQDARCEIADLARREVEAGRRVLLGFDFPFGYPAGTARNIGADGWKGIWVRLAKELPDQSENAQDRFGLAAQLNTEGWNGGGPFWGNGDKQDRPGLPRGRPDGYGKRFPKEWRLAEEAAKAQFRRTSTQQTWKLAGAGSVGSQALTGIAELERLRRDLMLNGSLAIWPFDGIEAITAARVVVVEIYPSIFPIAVGLGEPSDAAQVRTLASHFATGSTPREIAKRLRAPFMLNGAERDAVLREEGWIVGVEAPR